MLVARGKESQGFRIKMGKNNPLIGDVGALCGPDELISTKLN